MPIRGFVCTLVAVLAAMTVWPAGAAAQVGGPIVVEEEPDTTEQPAAGTGKAGAESRPAAPGGPVAGEVPMPREPVQVTPGAVKPVEVEPAVPVTRQINAKPEPVGLPLPPEGKQTIRRRARLERNVASGWSVLRFEDTPGKDKLVAGWVLPSRLLERMEGMIDKDPQTVFEVSCDNTTYDERCFVMLRGVRVAPTVVELPEAPKVPEPAAVPEAPRPATQEAQSRPADSTTSMPASGRASRPTSRRRAVGPSAKEVMQVLAREKPGVPVVVQDRRPTAGEAPRVAAPTAEQPDEALLEHTRKLIVNRRAILITTGSGAWKELRFYDDNNLQAPPLRVLPSAMLKRAEGFTGDIAITGEISVYRGRQYIYLHSAEPILPLDRF